MYITVNQYVHLLLVCPEYYYCQMRVTQNQTNKISAREIKYNIPAE